MSFQSAIPWQVAPPAEPASASPTRNHSPQPTLPYNYFSQVCSVTFLNEATRPERVVDARHTVYQYSGILRKSDLGQRKGTSRRALKYDIAACASIVLNRSICLLYTSPSPR